MQSTSILSKYKSILSNYTKYTFKVHKYTIIYFQSTKVYSGSTKGYFQSTQMYFRNTKIYFQSTKVYSRSTKVYSPSTKVYFQSTSILSNYTSILSKNKSLLWKYKSILSNYTKYTFKVHKYTIIYFQSTKVYSGSTKGYFQSTQMYFRNTKIYFQSTKVYSRSTKVYSPSTKVYFQSTSILSNYTSILSKNKSLLWKYKSILWRKNPKTRLLRVLFDSIDLLALFGVYAGIIPRRCPNGAKYLGFWTPTSALGKYQVHGLHGSSCLAGTRFSVSNHLDHRWLIRMNNQRIWTNRQLETSWNIYTSNLKTIENHFKFLPSLRPPPPGRNLEARSGPWRSGWCSDFYAHWQSSSTSVLKLFPFLLGFFSCIPMWSPLPVNNLHIFPAYRMTVRWLMHVFLVCCGTHSVCFVPRKARPEKSRKHDLDDHGSWVYTKKVWKWRSSTEKLIQTPFKMCPGRAVSIW